MLVTLIEDNEFTAKYLAGIIKKSSEYEILNVFKNGDQAVRFYEKRKTVPDIIILDIGLPGSRGNQIIRPLKEKIPKLKIMILTSFEEVEMIITCMQNGADGYLIKDIEGELLIAELDVLRYGGAPMTTNVALKILVIHKEKLSIKSKLSEREVRILSLISVGLSYVEISEKLNLSPHTVRRHIENIYKKLNVHSKYEAVEMAKKIGAI